MVTILILALLVVSYAGPLVFAILSAEREPEAGWRAAAKTLGFELGERQASGWLEHEVEIVSLTHRVKEPVAITLFFGTDLGMGLSLSPDVSRSHEPEPNLGWEFHDLYALHSADRAHAIELLRPLTPELLALRAAASAWVDDRSIRAVLSGSAAASEVLAVARRCDSLASALVARRALLPPSASDRQVSPLLDELARALGGERQRAAVVATRDGASLTIHRQLSPNGASQLNLDLQLEAPMPVELTLTDEAERSALDRLKSPDIQLQDKEFDRAFVIRGDSEDALRELLTKPARQALLALRREVRRLKVTRDWISCELVGDAHEAASVLAVAHAMEQCAAELGRRRRLGSGPYREA